MGTQRRLATCIYIACTEMGPPVFPRLFKEVIVPSRRSNYSLYLYSLHQNVCHASFRARSKKYSYQRDDVIDQFKWDRAHPIISACTYIYSVHQNLRHASSRACLRKYPSVHRVEISVQVGSFSDRFPIHEISFQETGHCQGLRLHADRYIYIHRHYLDWGKARLSSHIYLLEE